MLPMLAPEAATMSAIVAAVNPLVANTSVAASRIRRWVAPVLASAGPARRSSYVDANGNHPTRAADRWAACPPPPTMARRWDRKLLMQ